MIKNFFNVAGADAVKRIAEWIRHKFYTKTEIDDMLSAGMRYEVVDELPATGEAGTVYLVPKQSAGTGDVYDEYIYVDGSFEHIGSTEIDLSNYYTKTEADNLLGDKVDKVSGKDLSTEDYTTAEKTKLGGIEAGAEVNVQSDWNQSDSTKDDFIKNKPTLRQPSTDGTSGQYLKSNGSGNAPSWETMDTVPTANSTKAVTSGGVKTALDGKQASVTITTNANTPTDNDTVIMQDNGNTGTTSFLRRKLSTLWTWIKTHFDSSPTSGSNNGITSGGVYSALEEKVNLQPDFTASQIDYSAGNVGKWQKVLRFPEGADLVINMKKTAMGSDSTSTLWFSSSSMGDSYTSLFGNHSVRFVHDGGYVFLVLACRKSTYEPIESYTFQIAHSSVPMSDIVAVTDASPITATPNEPNIVYRAPITTGAVSFNVTNGAGSVNMSGHNDFLGNMTSEATNGVVVTMSGATEGQIYRFVFTRNITGGVTFKQSNVAYCTISGDVNAGDTITLTAVSNTADGWLYEQESAGIKSTDGSVNVEYDGGVADLSINIPPDVVRNNEWTSSVGHRVLAIGEGASADTSSNNVAIGKEADASGNSAVCVGGNSEASGNYSSSFGHNAEASAFGAVAVGGNAVANGTGAVAIGGNQPSQATTSAGYSVAIGGRVIAPSNSVAIGHNANGGTGSHGTTIGKDAESAGSYTCAVGFSAKANNDYAIAVGVRSEANYANSIAFGAYAVVCKKEVDANDNVKYRRFKAMSLQSFTVDGEIRKFYKPATAGDVTITFSGGGTATVSVTNGTLFVVSDSSAPNITSIFNGIMINGMFYDTTEGTISLDTFTVTPIAGFNAWAIDIKMPLAYIDTSGVNNAQILTEVLSSYSAEGCAFGNQAKSYGGYALGRMVVSTFPRQTVVGTYNVPSDSDYFQVGCGNSSAQRRNILTIDSNERLRVCSYVGETQTIEMSQQTGSLSNITKSIYRIRWNDTGTVNLTLDTGGCVEGQRVTIFAETNDVKLFAQPYLIRQGRFCDFMFLGGAWRPSMGIEELVS